MSIIGCTSIKTNTSHDSSVDFSQLKTYAWGKNDTHVGRLGRGADAKLEGVEDMARREIQPIIDAELAAKGFVIDTSGNPDFLIRYIATGSVQNDIPQTYYPGSPPSLTHAATIGTFMMGAVQIEVINPDTNKLMWQGYGETPITGDGTRTTKLTRALRKILRDFPPS
ncbi:DUF4136 domain-containing protein [Kaarinaea lacus]